MSFAIEPAVLVDIHQESKKDFVQGVKKDEHSLSDNSHSPDVIQEEKCHVLKYKVHGPRQELFHYANVDKFIRDFYLPKNKKKRSLAKLLKEIKESCPIQSWMLSHKMLMNLARLQSMRNICPKDLILGKTI